MSKIEELMTAVRKTNERFDSFEKTIQGVANQRIETADVLRKALMGGGNGHPLLTGFSGGDGSTLLAGDTLSLLRVSGGRRQKALGMGQFLQHVNEGCEAKGRNNVVEKALEKMGSRHITKATSLAEATGASGGYTVPTVFYADLMRLVAEASFVKAQCTTIPMTSVQCQVPALDQSQTPATGTSAFFGGITAYWQPEAVEISESDPSFRQVNLVARNLVFITIASNQLLDDNAVALDTLLTTLFTEAMAWFMDYYILRGNGVNQPLGVLNAPATYSQSRGAPSTFKLVDAANMISRLLMSSWKNAMWVMHPSVLPQLIQMTNGATNAPFLVWSNPAGPTNDGPAAAPLPANLFGIPIYFTEKVPALGSAGDVMLVDMSKYLIGDRMTLQIESSQYPKFTKNQMVWRIIARWDGQPWLNAPVKLADGTYQVSPFVALAA